MRTLPPDKPMAAVTKHEDGDFPAAVPVSQITLWRAVQLREGI